MTFKGSEVMETMFMRKAATEIICDTIVSNAAYMHYIRSEGLPLLIKALKTGGPKKEIGKMFQNIDSKMDFLFRFFKRYSDFLKPMRLIRVERQNT